MCGRFNIESSPLAQWLLATLGVAYPGPDNHNAAPTETIAVLVTEPEEGLAATPMRWWLTPHWAKERSTRYSMFNARRETLATSPAFREPFRQHRCVVPISGFYEWSGKPPHKQAWYIRPHTGGGLLLAGIWDRWSDPGDGATSDSFAVVTTAAAPQLAFVHTRQPVMLSVAAAQRWLDPHATPAELETLLEPVVPGDLDAVPVSSHVNNARHKDLRCLDPIAEPVPVSGGSGGFGESGGAAP